MTLKQTVEYVVQWRLDNGSMGNEPQEKVFSVDELAQAMHFAIGKGLEIAPFNESYRKVDLVRRTTQEETTHTFTRKMAGQIMTGNAKFDDASCEPRVARDVVETPISLEPLEQPQRHSPLPDDEIPF